MYIIRAHRRIFIAGRINLRFDEQKIYGAPSVGPAAAARKNRMGFLEGGGECMNFVMRA